MDGKWLSRLFEAPLEDFVQARDALVRELREKGKDDEAKAVKAVRKPSKALWLVNDVARREPAQVKALIAATARLRKAQEKGASGDELREAMREQREALNALTAAAGDASVERRVHDTLQAAAMADPDALRGARIAEELQPAGFDAVFGLDLAPRAHAAQHGSTKASAAHAGSAHGRAHAGRETAGGTTGDAAAAKREAEAKKQREHELRAARKEADRLAAQAKKLETAAEHAERAAAKAEEEARAAQRTAEKAREKADAAMAEARTARARATEAALHAGRAG